MATRSCDWTAAQDALLLREDREGTAHGALASILTRAFGRRITVDALEHRLRRLRANTDTPVARQSRRAIPPRAPELESVDVDLSDLEARAFPEEEARTEPVAPVAEAVPAVRTPAEETAQELRERRLREQVRELEAARKRLLDELSERDAQLETLGELRRAPAAPMFVARDGRGEGRRRQGVPCLALSDWHVEEPVKPESVNGLNEYNLSIADACIDRCADAFEWLGHDSRYDCREAIVWLGGDLLSGWIHQELVEANFLSPVQAVMWLQERLERMLQKILATTPYERILVVANDGNHGRLSNKMRVSTRTANSIEWLLYKSLAARFAAEPRLVWQIAEGEWAFVEVYGRTIGFTHGDSFRYLGGVGGLLIPVRRGINEMRKYRRLDLTVMGHFHQRLDVGDIVVNGSMIGVNPYSMHIHAAPEPRQQTWFLLDSERFRALSAPVWL